VQVLYNLTAPRLYLPVAQRMGEGHYDAENQLSRIDFPDTTVTTYVYDGLGRRIQKNVNGILTRYVYDNEDILQEYDGLNNLVAKYTHGPGIDEPLSLERDLNQDGTFTSDERFFTHPDGLGSLVALTNASGQVVERYRYDSFGTPTILNADNNTLSCSAFGNPYLFTGREYDCESGLHYFRARYDDPKTGRFLQEDPFLGILPYPQTLNRYPYVTNNPATLIDPTGQNPLLIAALSVGQLLIETALFTAITGNLSSGLLATGALTATQLGTLGVIGGVGMAITGVSVGSPLVTGFGLGQTAVGANIVRLGINALSIILSKGKNLTLQDLQDILSGKLTSPEICPP